MRTEPARRSVPALARTLCGLAVVAWAAALSAAPKVWIDRAEADFGRVKRGETASVPFAVANRGDEELRFEGAQVSMPGMSVRVKQSVAPGEETQLEVLWDTSRYQQAVEGTVELKLNDPSVSTLTLTVSGTVFGAIDVLPYPVVFLSAFRGESASRELEVVNHQDRPLEILRLERKGSAFRGDIRPVVDGQRYVLEVSTHPEASVGEYREFLTLHTDSPERPKVGIQVNVLIKPDVYVAPGVVNFGQVRLADIQDPEIQNFLTQTVMIQRRTGKMEITSISSDIDLLMYAVQPLAGQSDVFRLSFNLDPSKVVPGSVNGTIKVETDDTLHPLLEIPVSGQILD